MSRKIVFFIDNNKIGMKIKDFLKCNGVSHRMLCILKRTDGGILKNGEHARVIDILENGDCLTINIPDDEKGLTSTPVSIPLDIIFEDDDILVINKQAMIAMHETHNHQGDALSNAVAAHFIKEGKPCVFRSVGRLDKGTSGIVVCAKNKFAAAKLSGKIYKEYLAVATGIFNGEGVIDAPIFRPDPMKTLRCVDKRGERAVTHWEAIKSVNGCTLLKIHLDTGRTHQIRVHFASVGAPLVGDDMYGSTDKRLCHQALHCYYIKFTHPITNEEIEFSTPMPKDMYALI